MDPKRKLFPTIQQLVGARMKLPLSSHTHLHQPLATEGASLERKGNEWEWACRLCIICRRAIRLEDQRKFMVGNTKVFNR